MSFISFDYQKINEINIHILFGKILGSHGLPECINEEIISYLFPNHEKIMKLFYEQKCDDYRVTRETTFKIMKFSYYDFTVQFVKTLLYKHYYLNDTIILPYMRCDVYYFRECNMKSENFLVNKDFLVKNYLVFLVLFCEVYYTFKNCDTYFCLYGNNYANINQRYVNYLEKVKHQISFHHV
jgi:hypothetical protein